MFQQERSMHDPIIDFGNFSDSIPLNISPDVVKKAMELNPVLVEKDAGEFINLQVTIHETVYENMQTGWSSQKDKQLSFLRESKSKLLKQNPQLKDEFVKYMKECFGKYNNIHTLRIY